MKRFWRLLNSRKFAVYLLFGLLLVLTASSVLPSEFTVPADEWGSLAEKRPVIFWLSERFSTPIIVRNPLFIAMSLFLFLSTFVCTVTRINGWLKARQVEFEKEKAFSFSVERGITADINVLTKKIEMALKRKGWEYSTSQGEDGSVVSGQKGSGTGFWGSVVFHIGLIFCFLGAPITAFTAYRAKFISTEGLTQRFADALVFSKGVGGGNLSDLHITVTDLRGIYAKGIYKVDFGGHMIIDNGRTAEEFEFSVNNPIRYKGHQISIHEFGYSPGVFIAKKDGAVVLDAFLNQINRFKGDYFNLPDGRSLFTIFFPDFFREGSKIGTKTNNPNNPVLLLKIFEGGKERSKTLIKLGEEAEIGDYIVKFTELRNWASFHVVREYGLPVIIVGLGIGVTGLFVRFLSNERRLEILLKQVASGTNITLRGYSRYYPAFLEKEVNTMADELINRSS